MLKSRSIILTLAITLLMATCSSATAGQSDILQSPTPTLFLPFVTKNHPEFIFGVDGNTNFDKMKDADVKMIRLNAQLWWSQIEQTEGQYDWDKAQNVESYLKDAANKGMDVILLVQTSPEWARKYENSVCGPIKEDKLGKFGDFLYEVVRRYSQPPYNVKYFQIWNEPDQPIKQVERGNNNGCWADSEEGYQGISYGKMLSVVYPRIKDANPDAQVVIGSLMLLCDPREERPQDYCAQDEYRKSANFFEGVLQEAKYSFDLVAFNAGPSFEIGKNPVWSEKNNWRWRAERGGMVDGKIEYLRESMAKYGVVKPIIHSEAYYLDRKDEYFDQFEEYKADYLVWVYANDWSQHLRGVTWYTVEGWKGSELINSSSQETKAFRALKTMTGFLKNAEYLSREDKNGFTKFVFRSGGETIWLMIPTGEKYGETYTITKPANFRRMVDLFGELQNVTEQTISFARPVYIFLNP